MASFLQGRHGLRISDVSRITSWLDGGVAGSPNNQP
jgi:hypothetical protein